MPGFELSIIENTRIDNWDFEKLNRLFTAAAAEYSSRVYTDEASAKADKAELNKIKKIVEDKRKEYKNQCLAPYNTAEKQIKELLAIITAEQDRMTRAAETFEQERKNKKAEEIKEVYIKRAACLGEYSEAVYRKIFDEKWLNASVAKKRYEEEMTRAIARADDEIAKLKSLDSPFAKAVLEQYLSGADFDSCLKKNEEYISVNQSSGTAIPAAAQAAPSAAIQSSDKNRDGVTVKIKASQSRINKLTDFMNAIGIEFEIL